MIGDSSEIWWDLRPSHSYPTLETRICDVSPRMEHALSIAALTQALTRMLVRLRDQNLSWRSYDRFLISENRWRAQRYGVTEPLIDFGQRSLRPFPDLLDELIELVAEDAEALGCSKEVLALRSMVEQGTSATRQRAVFAQASGDADQKGQAVVRHLIEEFETDL